MVDIRGVTVYYVSLVLMQRMHMAVELEVNEVCNRISPCTPNIKTIDQIYHGGD